MPRGAWAYLWFILLVGLCLGAFSLFVFDSKTGDWLTFGVLAVFATVAQLSKTLFQGRESREGGTISYSPLLVFLVAGVFLLNPGLFTLLVLVPHGVEWVKEYRARAGSLPAWYIQPFNIASHLTVGLISQWVFLSLSSRIPLERAEISLVPAILATLLYLFLNHLILGQMVILARGLTWRGTGLLRSDTLMSDGIMLTMGYAFALLWRVHPLMSIPTLAPLVLVQQALMVPQLRKEASIDGKTGLYNAAHFNTLFAGELKRAKRFARPMALILADLDLLRNINNTYGHLAGDAVLKGIGRIIRETIREYDIAGRFGGEEFIIAMPESGLDEARALAERIRLAVQAAHFRSPTVSGTINASLSFGVACFPDQGREATELIHQADIAVYQAKLQGRNRVICAAEIPLSVRLDQILSEERMETRGIAPAPPQPVNRVALPKPQAEKETTPPAKPTIFSHPRLNLYLGSVVAAGICIAVLGGMLQRWPDPVSLELFVVLAVLGELFEVNVYGDNTFSVSMGVTFAAAIVMSVPGVIATSAAIALTHYYRNHPVWYRVAFNWATHVLAGAIPAVLFAAIKIPLDVENLPLLLGLTALTGAAYYLVETGLIGHAIALSTGKSFSSRWKEQFGWLVWYYVVLAVIGLILAVLYTGLGVSGLIVYGLPLLLMHYANRQYITRTRENVEELRRLNEELALSNQQVLTASQAIQQLNDELFVILARINDARDPYVSSHVTQVAKYATAIAEEMGLPVKRIELVRQAAFLHDVGKIGIPEDVLHKPARLSSDEYEYVKRHSLIGANLLKSCPSLKHLVPFVRHHHEWWDGSGYPDGFRQGQIPLESRILSVADAVEAMASDRPYHHANNCSEIIAELRRCSGSQFDPEVVEAFARVIEHEPSQFVVNSTRHGRSQPAHQANLFE